MQSAQESCRTLLIAIRRITQAVDQHSRSLERHYGLTGPQLIVLQALAEGPEEGLAVGDLARRIHLSPATVTDIVDRLSRRGLVERRRCESDRRRILVSMLAPGRETAHRAPTLLQERLVRQFEKLEDWERHQLLASLQRLAAMMDAEHLEVPPLLSTGPATDPATAGDDSDRQPPAPEGLAV